jgi:hypothetical protein
LKWTIIIDFLSFFKALDHKIWYQNIDPKVFLLQASHLIIFTIIVFLEWFKLQNLEVIYKIYQGIFGKNFSFSVIILSEIYPMENRVFD